MDVDHFSSINKYHRRVLVGLVSLSFVLLAGLYFLIPRASLAPETTKLLQDFVIKLFSAILGASFAAAAFVWFVPEKYKVPVVRVVYPHEIKKTLRDSLNGVTEFQFFGQTGGWTRAVTLPGLAEMANSQGLQVSVTITIIDPRDSALCKQYAQYRSSTKIRPPGPLLSGTFDWKEHSTKLELLSTIIAAYRWAYQEPRLQIHIALSHQFSVFRVDLTDKAAIVTQEDPRLPALVFDRESCHYASIRMDVQQKFAQSFKLPSVAGLDSSCFEDLDAKKAEDVLRALALNEASFTPADYEHIANTVKKPRNPYEV